MKGHRVGALAGIRKAGDGPRSEDWAGSTLGSGQGAATMGTLQAPVACLFGAQFTSPVRSSHGPGVRARFFVLCPLCPQAGPVFQERQLVGFRSNLRARWPEVESGYLPGAPSLGTHDLVLPLLCHVTTTCCTCLQGQRCHVPQESLAVHCQNRWRFRVWGSPLSRARSCSLPRPLAAKPIA